MIDNWQLPSLTKPLRYTILKALEIAEDNPSGFTVSNDMTESPSEGYSVACAATQNHFGLPGFLKALAYAIENDLHFGGSLNEATNEYTFDACRIFPVGQLKEATQYAVDQGQIAFFDLSNDVVLYTEELAKKLNTQSAQTDESGWVCTDPDCNQYMRPLGNDTFEFREDRVVDPSTGKIEVFRTINLNDYTLGQMQDYCKPYGYNPDQVTEWFSYSGESLSLIAECIFEQS